MQGAGDPQKRGTMFDQKNLWVHKRIENLPQRCVRNQKAESHLKTRQRDTGNTLRNDVQRNRFLSFKMAKFLYHEDKRYLCKTKVSDTH